MIKLSFIIPVYNAQKYLNRCLDSVLSQSFKLFEVLCIDDCSSDDSYKILCEYQKKDKRVKVFKNATNKGVSYSRNVLIDKAEGEYIQFLDADDYLEIDGLEIFDSVYEKSVDIAFFKCNIIPQNSDIDITRVPGGIENDYKGINLGTELLGKFVLAKEFFYYPAMLFIKKSFLINSDIKFAPLKVGEGGEFILRSMIKAEKVMVLNNRIYNYFIHSDSATRSGENSNELLIGNIIQYASVLKIAMECPLDHNIDIFLQEHLKKISGTLINISIEEKKRIASKLENTWTRHVFNTMINCNNDYRFTLTDEMLKTLKSKDSIIIYGAGNMFKYVLQLVNENELNVVGVAVSDYNNNPKVLYGHRVYIIEDLENYAKNTCVLIAVKKKYHEEIIKKIKKYGFETYVCLDVAV